MNGCSCFAFALGIGMYLFVSFMMFKIGEKFGIGAFWEWCIPIYNIYLLCQCAQVTPLWILAFFVPFVQFIGGVYLWGVISARLGKNFWLWGLLCGLFFLPLLVLAFDDSTPVPDPELPF